MVGSKRIKHVIINRIQVPPTKLAFCRQRFYEKIKSMKRNQFAAILFSLNLMASATAFSSVSNKELQARAQQIVTQSNMHLDSTASEIVDLAFEVQQMTGDIRQAPEVRDLVEMVEQNIDGLLRDGDVVSIAMAAWALSSHKLSQSRSLVSLLETLTDDDGRIRHCKSYCKETLALTYLSLTEQNPARAQRLQKQIEKLN